LDEDLSHLHSILVQHERWHEKLKPSRRDGRASRPEAGRKGEKDGYFDELCRFFFTFSSKFSS
jgi:hypothetical protein